MLSRYDTEARQGVVRRILHIDGDPVKPVSYKNEADGNTYAISWNQLAHYLEQDLYVLNPYPNCVQVPDGL